ncbi:hypothetical protein P7K49_036907 [Saguinus oedipus]|uniref:Uncharacterized protein n=1 Tax=Saguinus oedipus TaxID=9490 RepID=A0ABQ9TLG9_SAGOE|nr:hypothetical protein P7K49_036907 [Saguinus oedipus]
MTAVALPSAPLSRRGAPAGPLSRRAAPACSSVPQQCPSGPSVPPPLPQVVDIPEELLEEHDITVDYILTPTRVIATGCERPKPMGITWSKELLAVPAWLYVTITPEAFQQFGS